ITRAATVPEGWPSGLRRTLGKRVYGKPYRGFESHSLRQPTVRHRPSTSRKSLNYMYFSRILWLRTCRHVCHNRRYKRWYGRWSTVRAKNGTDTTPPVTYEGQDCEGHWNVRRRRRPLSPGQGWSGWQDQ